MPKDKSSTGSVGIEGALSADAAAAQARVFEHWDYLNAAANKRFQWDEGLATAALDYAIGEMASNNWSRVRAWKGTGTFRGFVTTMAARLFTDFDRQQNGYQRPPTWLTQKEDPLWRAAYRLLVIRRFEKREVVQLLAASDERRDRLFLEQMVAVVNGRCAKQLQRNAKSSTQLPDSAESGLISPAIFEELSDGELLGVLRQLLNASDEPIEDSPPPADFNHRVSAIAKLTDEDRLILKLRYRDGLSVQDIKRSLNYDGDLYKRLKRMLAKLRKAIRAVGIEP